MVPSILAQCREELDRIAIAGSSFIVGDFRVRNLLKPLEQMGTKASIVKKIYQLLSSLYGGEVDDIESTLLEVSTILNAVLRTQASVANEGSFVPLTNPNSGHFSQPIGYRTLEPLLSSLRGHYSFSALELEEVLEKSHSLDVRLIAPALGAFEIRSIPKEGIERIVTSAGEKVLPHLLREFSMKGKTADARRLAVIAQILGDGAKEILLESLENGNSKVQVVAIKYLAFFPESKELLLRYALERKKSVRLAALEALGNFEGPEVAACLLKGLYKKNYQEVVDPIKKCRDPELLNGLLGYAQERILKFLEQDPVSKEEIARFDTTMEMLRSQSGAALESFLFEWIDQHETLLSHDLGRMRRFRNRELLQELFETLAVTSKSTRAANRALTFMGISKGHFLKEIFYLALSSLGAKKVYDIFARPHTKLVSSKKDPKSIEFYLDQLEKFLPVPEGYQSFFDYPRYARSSELVTLPPLGQDVKVDRRWLTLALKQKNYKLVFKLMKPGDETLRKRLEKNLKSTKAWDLPIVLLGLLRAGHPNVAELLRRTIVANRGLQHAYLEPLLGILPLLSKADIELLMEQIFEFPEWIIRKIEDVKESQFWEE